MTTDNRPPRMQMVWDVLESALDNSDALVVGACRRLIAADRIGWRKHTDPGDWALVRSFVE